GETPRAHVRRLARAKALAIRPKRKNVIVIGVDTVVVLDRTILGKPRDALHARRLLKKLSGRWHTVMSGLAVRDVAHGTMRVRDASTRVKFAKLTREQIEWYVKTGEPFGKAGAYAIQGKGAAFLEHIQGSLTNVIGLPMELLTAML
ncbi:MAG: septum formation protein Maf, partial [Deltaproteobacteria bacterium]|nr:septum formation protein Maf [Deltaproteobacteria bacterium]